MGVPDEAHTAGHPPQGVQTRHARLRRHRGRRVPGRDGRRVRAPLQGEHRAARALEMLRRRSTDTAASRRRCRRRCLGAASAEELKIRRAKEAQLILHEAELKARQMVNESYAEQQGIEKADRRHAQRRGGLPLQVPLAARGVSQADRGGSTGGRRGCDESDFARQAEAREQAKRWEADRAAGSERRSWPPRPAHRARPEGRRRRLRPRPRDPAAARRRPPRPRRRRSRVCPIRRRRPPRLPDPSRGRTSVTSEPAESGGHRRDGRPRRRRSRARGVASAPRPERTARRHRGPARRRGSEVNENEFKW